MSQLVTNRELSTLLSEFPPGLGWRAELPVGFHSVRGTNGAPLTDSTDPAFSSSSNEVEITCATDTAFLVAFHVPRDFDDRHNKELVLQLVARLVVGTNTPTIAPSLVVRSPGGSARTITAVDTVDATGTDATTYSIDLSDVRDSSDNPIRPGDSITVYVDTGSHSSNMVITDVCGYYRRSPNFTVRNARTSADGDEQTAQS